MRWNMLLWVGAVVLMASSGVASTPVTYRFALAPAASAANAKVAFFGLGSRTASFPALQGNVALSPAHMDQIKLDVAIDATQLKAGDKLTMDRLKSKDFFYVEKYPTIRFKGTKLAMTDTTHGIVYGELTARGVSRPVALNVGFSAPPAKASGKDAIQLTAATTINRNDFGMKAYPVIVGKKVSIAISTRLMPQ